MSKHRKFIHIDMDCYFAAIEMRDNPSLRDVPMAIGGAKERRGVIATCNYLAREYGVKSAMSTAMALKLCPQLVLVPGRMQVYKDTAEIIRNIFYQYTDLVEPVSIDEAYLDVTDCALFNNCASDIARAIREQIYQTTALTASAGISSVKFVAKIGSDLNKPNGQFMVTPNNIEKFLSPLAVSAIPGVGKVMTAKLQGLGIETIAQLRLLTREQLIDLYGKFGQVLYQRARGIDPRVLQLSRLPKSMAKETTLSEDIHTIEQAEPICLGLLEYLKLKLIQLPDMQLEGIRVKIKDASFKVFSKECKTSFLAADMVRGLLQQLWQQNSQKGVRLVGVCLRLQPKPTYSQLNLFD
ncbi:DNA polymerase IV [Paraferrimonas sp. SM1919]|uniref:DNA polymerase IV n=1 Tax=Paraferrimonas sp. SM1919 TaxID=2662263 RepID=UPI0013D0E057|nr:DNA polymerase IV [Paraferrimonas sp. SM1919]